MLPQRDRFDRGAFSRRRVLLVVGACFVLTGLTQALIPLRASDLGANGAVLGLLLVLAGGGLGLFTDLGLAAYADARGRGGVVAAGFAFGLMGILTVGLSDSRWLFAVGCLAAGLANSAIFASLLALLTLTADQHGQARAQGFNVATQRLGALVSALLIGAALLWRRDSLLAFSGAAVCVAALAVIARPRTRPHGSSGTQLVRLMADGYRRGLTMFSRRKIVLASLLSFVTNLMFIETNSFLPLFDSRRVSERAAVITAALVARDLVAVSVGVLTIATGRDAARLRTVAGSLLAAVLGAALVGLDGGRSGWTVFACGLQGVGVGVGVVAMNLLTVGGSSPEHRSLGMASATLINRLGVIVVPPLLGLSLEVAGLRSVFVDVAGTILVVAVVFVVVSGEPRPPKPAAGRVEVKRP